MPYLGGGQIGKERWLFLYCLRPVTQTSFGTSTDYTFLVVELFPVRDAIFDNLFCGGGNHSLYMEENMKNMLSTGWDLKSHACGKTSHRSMKLALQNWGGSRPLEPWSCGFFKRFHRWNQGLGIATLWYFCQHRSGPGWVGISFKTSYFWGAWHWIYYMGFLLDHFQGGSKWWSCFSCWTFEWCCYKKHQQMIEYQVSWMMSFKPLQLGNGWKSPNIH